MQTVYVRRRIKNYKRKAVFIIALALCCITILALTVGYKLVASKITASKISAIKNSSEWKNIYAHTEDYPSVLLDDLERNPEMIDFVEGYLNAGSEATGGITLMESLKKFPLFIQWDKRWGYTPYGQSNLGISGCGPTCLSMVIYSLSRDKDVTPDALAQRAMEEGYYVKDVGTAWSFLTDIVNDYGIFVSQFTSLNEAEMKDRLDDGNVLICAMGPGDFTNQGHFIVIRGYSKDYFLLNDPFSYANSNKKWDYAAISDQIQQIWVYSC